MFIKFFGIRGSIPAPATSKAITEKIKKALKVASKEKTFTPSQILRKLPFWAKNTYGGNTSCIYLKTDEHHFCFDCGSGMRELGYYLLPQEFGKGEGTLHTFISHTHWDHIQGIPFCVPIYILGNNINFYSCTPNIKKRLIGQQANDYFPVPFLKFGSNLKVKQCSERRSLKVGGAKISFKKMFHPGDSWATKIEYKGKKFIYAGDSEYTQKEPAAIKDILGFFQDADILVMDTMYTASESWEKLSWGHSSANVCLDMIRRANIKNFVMFHHEPTHSDKQIYHHYQDALNYLHLTAPGSKMKIHSAYEGLELKI